MNENVQRKSVSGIKYDEEKETKAAWDFKQKELVKIEEAKKKAAEKRMRK